MMLNTTHPIRRQIYAQIEQLPEAKLSDLLTFVSFLQYQTQESNVQTQAFFDADLEAEFLQWERASDEDWLSFEQLAGEAL